MKYKACEKCVKSLGWINVGGNSFIALIKVYLGIVGGSTALFADGIHSFGDVFGSATMLIGLKIAKKPKDNKYPYGYGKVEFIAATVIYTFLFFVGIYILITAIKCIVCKAHVNPDMVTIIGAIISLVANELMYRQSHCAGLQLNSPSMIANAHEKRADAIASIAVLIGIIGAKLGWHFLDPLAAILVSVFIFKICGEMLYKSITGLMDSSLTQEENNKIYKVLKKFPELIVINVRTRETGQSVNVEIDARVSPGSILKDLSGIKEKIQENITEAIERPGEVNINFVV